MHNKFKIDEMVIVNGIGKENGTIYKNRIAKVICRDPFYFDYNIKFNDGTEDWIDGKDCKETDIFTCKAIYGFHEYIRNVKEEQRAVLADKLIHQNPEIVLVSDEIGYGLVPIDAADRCYREQVGRICTELAAFSDEVVRVVMGIGTKIKG